MCQKLQTGNFEKECEVCKTPFKARRKVQRWCSKECQYEGKKLYEVSRYANSEDHRKYRTQKLKEWKQKNPERRKELNKKSNIKMKSSRRDKRLQKVYGITQKIYEELLSAQDNKCFICRKEKGEHEIFHVDHAHKSSDYVPEGMIRGILCNFCNHRFVGKHTNPEIFERAAKYLRQHTGYKVPDDQINPKRKRKKRKLKSG